MTLSTSHRIAAAALWLIAAVTPVIAHAHEGHAHDSQPRAFREEPLSFQSHDVTLNGTVLVPPGPGQKTAVVLVAGAGLGKRESNRELAEQFADAGFAAFIYDKRTQGYSADPTGARSFDLLADDAVAAVRQLQTLPSINPAKVGLWGVSEGGWVLPLAATKSDQIAFIITLAGTGVSPSAQTGWAVGEALHHHGLTSPGLHQALTTDISRFIVSAELMGEAAYNPVPVLERVKQPILAVWGAQDSVEPATESARVFAAALARAGNPSYTLRFIPSADHDGYATGNGFTRSSGGLAPGYFSTMTTWITAVTSGQPPASSADAGPAQARPAPVTTPPGFGNHWLTQTASLIFFTIAFLTYPVVAAWRLIRRHKPTKPATPADILWLARVLVPLATVTWAGTFYYLVSLYIHFGSPDRHKLEGTVIAGRPGTWLLLQLAAVAVIVLGAMLALAWHRSRVHPSERFRLIALLAGVAVFIPWALHWNLLTP